MVTKIWFSLDFFVKKVFGFFVKNVFGFFVKNVIGFLVKNAHEFFLSKMSINFFWVKNVHKFFVVYMRYAMTKGNVHTYTPFGVGLAHEVIYENSKIQIYRHL